MTQQLNKTAQEIMIQRTNLALNYLLREEREETFKIQTTVFKSPYIKTISIDSTVADIKDTVGNIMYIKEILSRGLDSIEIKLKVTDNRGKILLNCDTRKLFYTKLKLS